MKLELINKVQLTNSDMGDIPIVNKVWKISRNHLDYEDIDRTNLLSMGLPVSSFERYTIKIESSILLRDLLLTIRPITAWAQSLRIIKFDEDNLLLDPFHEQDEAKALVTDCISRVNNGEIQDYVKEDLPWGTLTTYVIDIDFRTFINLVHTFEVNGFTDYYNEFYKFFIECTGLTDLDYMKFKKSDLYPYVSINYDEEYEYLDRRYTDLGSMGIIGCTVKANLMAQFIRQHNHVVKNSLWNTVKLRGIDYLLKASLSTYDIDVIAYLDKLSIDNLISTRTCWFAQFDKNDNSSWSYVLEPLVRNYTPSKFMDSLPCKGNCNACKIKGDMDPKVKHMDRNLPCPILLEDTSFIKLRASKYGESNSSIMKKWIELDGCGKIKINASGSSGTREYNKLDYFKNADNTTNDNPRVLCMDAWTSELIVFSDIGITDEIRSYISVDILDRISKLYSKFDKSSGVYNSFDPELLINSSAKFKSDRDLLGEIANYDIKSKYYDVTCMLKGLALKLIHDYLVSLGSESHLINFGGDILGFNTSANINIANTNFYINKSGNFSIFTSGNTDKRGNHIVMKTNDISYGSTGTLVIDDINDPVYYDALSTLIYSDSSLDITVNNLYAYIVLDADGKLVGNTYCASPFFNNEDVYIRDKMIQKLNDVYRPDLTKNSDLYNGEPSRDSACLVYNENIENINNSSYLVYPMKTKDLGTLFEVGYAVRHNKLAIRYDLDNDTYTFVDTVLAKDIINSLFSDVNYTNYKYNNDLIIDCSKVTGAFILGYFNELIKKYTVGKGMDNIMLAIEHYRHEKDINGNYVLTPNKFMVGM